MLFTSTEWVEGIDDFDHETHYAETSDPRVLAIIEREPDYPREFFMDGDCICPTYYLDYGYGRSGVTYQGGDRDDEIAEAWDRARRILSWEATKRYMWIFHGTRFFHGVVAPGDRSGEWVAFNTPALRERTGCPEERAFEDVRSWMKEVEKWLDGDVWSVGYAINEGRLLHEIDVDFDEFVVTTNCGGFIGEDYAKTEAAGFPDGEPKLAELITNAEVFA
jgi:hypothetical protein